MNSVFPCMRRELLFLQQTGKQILPEAHCSSPRSIAISTKMNEASREETLTCVSLQCSCLPIHADHVNTSVNINLCLYKDCAENEALKSKPELRLTQDGLSP